MKILFLTQVLPHPLDAGPKVRAYYVLRYLARRHQITLASFTRPSDPQSSLDHLKCFCEQVLTVPIQRSRISDILALGKSILHSKPFLIQRDLQPEMTNLLRSLVMQTEFDAIHADQLWMAAYALQAAETGRSSRKSPYLVLDQHNAVYLIPERMAAGVANPLRRFFLQREARLMADYENTVCKQFNHILWVTQEDWKAVARLAPANGKITDQKRNTVMPICIDALSSSDSAPFIFQGEPPSNGQPSTLLFLGGMHWPPNAEGIEWFVKAVFPIVRAKIPEAQLYAIGKSPPESILSVPGVHAPGYVVDVEDYWKNAQVFIVPLHAGGGMRVKIVDAWAHRLPIISTTIGAEGLAYQNGENILIADTPLDFANAIISLLDERKTEPAASYRTDLWWKLSSNGRITVEERYQWDKVYNPLDKIYP